MFKGDAQAAVLEVLERAVSSPISVLSAIGEPTRAGIEVIHQSIASLYGWNPHLWRRFFRYKTISMEPRNTAGRAIRWRDYQGHI
jgi:hypothetical protein